MTTASLGCEPTVPRDEDPPVRPDASVPDVQAPACDPQAEDCGGPCSPDRLGTSYIGCEYYPTVTGNTVANMFDFAVAIANTDFGFSSDGCGTWTRIG